MSGSLVHDDRIVHVEHVWGTAISINVAGTRGRVDEALAAIHRCQALFERIDGTFSTFKALSEVTLFRAGLDRPGRQSTQFDEVMQACSSLRARTRGSFDPWAVPGGWDPSGYVKGWGAGLASGLLVEAGFLDHLVNAGGDIFARGDELPGSREGWVVGIVNPHDPREVIDSARLRDEGMATSGRYERGDHVIDPATGKAVVGVDSATVVGPDPGAADAFASAALVDGLASTTWFEGLGPGWSLHLVIQDTVHTRGTAFDEKAPAPPPAGPQQDLPPPG